MVPALLVLYLSFVNRIIVTSGRREQANARIVRFAALAAEVAPDTDQGKMSMVKRLLFFIFTAALAALLATSCEEDRGGVYQGNNGGGLATGKKLVKETRQRYTRYDANTSYEHTSGRFEGCKIQWSGNKITDVINCYYEHGALVEKSFGVQFIYDGDNLSEIRSQSSDFQKNIYFTYSNGHIAEIYETYVGDGYSGWKRHTMTYSSDDHLQEMTRTYDDGRTRRYIFTWSGDNIASVQQFSNGSLMSTINYTYDNKKSAYSEMPEWFAVLDIDDIDYWEYLSANNVIMESWADGDEVENTSYVYTYEGDYPVKRVENSYSDNYTQRTYTTYYEYADGTGASQVPQVCSINATANNSDWGYVEGDGEYAAGSTVVLRAEAYSGYTFQQWSDGNTQNPRTLTANGNTTYTAVFGSNSGGGSNNATASVSFNGTTWDAGSTYAYVSTSNNIFLVRLFKNDNEYPFAEVYYSAESGTITTGTKTGTSNVDISAQTADPGNPFMWYYTSDENGSISLGDEPCGDWWNRTMTLNITKFDLANMKLSFTATATMGNLMECVDGTASNWSQTSSCYMSVTATDLPMTYSSKSAPATRVDTQSHISKAGKATNRLADRLADGIRRHRIK